MPQTTRFVLDGFNFDYRTDAVRISWEVDRQDYRRLDKVVETDIREQLPIFRVESVWAGLNANANGANASELFRRIQEEVSLGNTVRIIPDTSYAGALTSRDPFYVDIKTRTGGVPLAYDTDKGTDQRRRTLTVQGAQWLDADVTADDDIITDITAFTDTLDLS